MLRRFRCRPAVFAVLLLLTLSWRIPAAEGPREKLPVRNVILLIGDGMGVSQITLGRLVLESRRDDRREPSALELDRFEVAALVRTHSADSLVTDSAAAATALACGVKTNNDVVGLDAYGQKRPTILEIFRQHGKAAGLVTTTTITHATPAAFAVHVPDRDDETRIAEELLGSGVEVLFGGGRAMFSAELRKKFQTKGYRIFEDRSSLSDSDKTPVLGLFSDENMRFELDRHGTGEPSLAEMTGKALDLLSADPDGLFLMVEGGRIDHACHGNDAASAAQDMLAFDEACGVVLAWAERAGQTLLIVTADHATGGMAILENADLHALDAFTASFEKMAQEIAGGKKIEDVFEEHLPDPIQLTKDELQQIRQARGRYEPANTLAKILSTRIGVAFSTHGHDGAMVPLFAHGPGSHNFHGVMDNTEIPGLILEAAGIPRQALEPPEK